MKTKCSLYIILLVCLCVPLSQYFFHYSSSKELEGFFVKKDKPKICLDSVLCGSFQEKYQSYFNDNCGFQSDFVRIRNQIYYSLFDMSFNPDFVVGKEGYLYEKDYISKGILGEDFVGSKVVEEKTRKILRLQDTLRKQDKDLLIVFAPGKGSYYEEYVPKQLLFQKKHTTNYSAYVSCFKKYKVNYIDFKSYFIGLKKTNKNPLYSKIGVHWNKYGTYLVIDSLMKYYNKSYPYMPTLVTKSMPLTDTIWYTENDCYKTLNLISRPKKQLLIHPEFYFKDKKTTKKRLTSIVVADSYYWPLCVLDFSSKYFYQGEYWYYNNHVFFSDGRKDTERKNIDFKKEVNKSDVFILMFTDATLKDFDRGFINSLYNMYFNKKK